MYIKSSYRICNYIVSSSSLETLMSCATFSWCNLVLSNRLLFQPDFLPIFLPSTFLCIFDYSPFFLFFFFLHFNNDHWNRFSIIVFLLNYINMYNIRSQFTYIMSNYIAVYYLNTLWHIMRIQSDLACSRLTFASPAQFIISIPISLCDYCQFI